MFNNRSYTKAVVLKVFFLSLLCSLVISLPIAAFAQAKPKATPPAEGTKTAETEEEEKKEDNEKIMPGVIASYGIVKQSGSISQGSTGVGGEKAISPLSASISKKNDRTCTITVSNQSEKHSYSASFKVESSSATGKVRSRKSFSATLKPGASSTKSIACVKDGGMRVTLKSGKRLSS